MNKQFNSVVDHTYSISICIPLYNSSHLLNDLLNNIFSQRSLNNFDYEIIIGDDNKPEMADEIKRTQDIIAKFDNTNIKYIKNQKNLGYATNLKNIVNNATKDLVILVGNDDVLAIDAIDKIYNAFLIDKKIGVVTRPYFWFEKNINQPIRAVTPYHPDNIYNKVTSQTLTNIFPTTQPSKLSKRHNHDMIDQDISNFAHQPNSLANIVTIWDKAQFFKIFESIGQFSGLAYKRKLIDIPFNTECFPAHIYPFAGILKNYKCAFLNDYIVAVGSSQSQTRTLSDIYDLSPTLSWLKMYNTVFKDPKYKNQLKWGKKHILTNYAGLLQLKNYAKKGVLTKEILILIKLRPLNLLNYKFWIYVLLCSLTPRQLLIRFVAFYKNKILSPKLKGISFNHPNYISNTNLTNPHTSDLPVTSDISTDLYSQNYYQQNGLYGFTATDRMDHQAIISLCKFDKSDIVLDIGCGFGTLLAQLDVLQKHGTESNQFAVNQCHTNGLKNVILHQDPYNLPYEDNYFDKIIINELIEHISNPDLLLKQIYKKLKPKGKIIITTPNKTFLVKNLSQTHVSEMTYKELTSLLDVNKFTITKHLVSGVSFWDFLGRKFIYPIAKFIKNTGLANNVIDSTRHKIDHSKISKFRSNLIWLGTQQLVIATANKN